jgi:hypothetical protein
VSSTVVRKGDSEAPGHCKDDAESAKSGGVGDRRQDVDKELVQDPKWMTR